MDKDHSYRVPGGRVGVLLLHGLCGTPTEMRFVANGLARSGCTVHCPQLAGHCGTEADIKATRWQDWYASAERALDDMRKDCDVVIVGGLVDWRRSESASGRAAPEGRARNHPAGADPVA